MAKKQVRSKVSKKTEDVTSMSVPTPSFSTKKTTIILVSVVALIALAYFGRQVVFAATVNGAPILRTSVLTLLEKQGGKEVLDGLVTKSLIVGEAKKMKIVVSQAEIDAEIDKISKSLESQEMTLDQALELQGETRAGLVENIKVQKYVEKLVGTDIKVEEAEILKYYTDNKDVFEKDKTYADVKEDIKAQLFNQKLSASYQTWIAGVRERASIHYFGTYR